MRRRRFPRLDDFRTSELAIAAGLVLMLGAVLLFLLADKQRSRDRETAGTGALPERRIGPPATPAKPCEGQKVGIQRRRQLQTLPTPTSGQAAPADAVVDSIGVNVHLGYTDTAYGNRDAVERKLKKLGIRYIRDGLNPGQDDVYASWRALASCGIRLDLLVGDPLHRHGIGSLESQLALLKREQLAPILASIEGPNEFDVQGASNWQSLLRDFQPRLYRMVKSDPDLSGVSVVGPSLIDLSSHHGLGDLGGSLDYGNIHPYPSGQPPDRDSHMNKELTTAAINSGSKPVQATETGYHNAVRSQSPHQPASERAAGIYMPRLYLDYFRRGIARTFTYELVDERPDPDNADLESNFGLLRNDFSEKPAFVALQRLISLLGDPGPDFKTRPLRYTLHGAPPNLRRLLLEKRDGSFYLALWDENAVWDPGARHAENAPVHTLRLAFPGRVKQITVYRPSDSDKAVIQRSDVRSLSLEASASVAVVKITP